MSKAAQAAAGQTAQQADPLAWARRLRTQEHAAGLGWKGMTRFNRVAWRDALAAELTERERQTMPRKEEQQQQRRR